MEWEGNLVTLLTRPGHMAMSTGPPCFPATATFFLPGSQDRGVQGQAAALATGVLAAKQRLPRFPQLPQLRLCLWLLTFLGAVMGLEAASSGNK